MTTESQPSIFQRYYSDEPFVDRYASDPAGAVDVIIPVIHSNELWEANLQSIYREIPVARLLIGDGGCVDDTVAIVSRYPRVVLHDHRAVKTIGYSERLLIEAVETEWFIHLHSDVFLPDGWFDAMRKHQPHYDYFGCLERDTVLVEFDADYGDRPWAGAQFGRTLAFTEGLKIVDDDFIYRQGDFLYRRMIEEGGFKEGFVRDTFHYHQAMFRKSAWQRNVKSVRIDVESSPGEEVRTAETMAKGVVKYFEPPFMLDAVVLHVDRLEELGVLSWSEFERWVVGAKPAWIAPLRKRRRYARVKRALRKLLRGRSLLL